MSIQYYVWICVEADTAEEWKKWMKNTHIPKVMQTGAFSSQKLYACEGPRCGTHQRAFFICYEAKSEEELQKYLSKKASLLRDEHNQRYFGKFQAERFVLR